MKVRSQIVIWFLLADLRGGHVQPKAVSETEEQDLAQLMAKASAENAEVSGDDDDEEAA